MSSKSNTNGRILEYVIVEEIIQQLQTQRQLTIRAQRDRIRDEQKYNTLPVDRQKDFQRCASRTFQWLNNQFSISSKTIISIDRLTDAEAQTGDVTDIRLILDSMKINLSVKYNHPALKHPRPARTAQHCGYPENSSEDSMFKRKYFNIVQEFSNRIPEAKYFKDVDSKTVKYPFLYEPTCEYVADFINSHCCSSANANALFKFLIGNEDFYKLEFYVKKGEIKIYNYSNLPPVASVRASVRKGNNVDLEFSNHWQLSLRLHNADDEIKRNQDPLKFDAQFSRGYNPPIPVSIIRI